MLQLIWEYDFLQRALCLGFFSALLSSTLGVYMVINHLGAFGGAVSHTLLGGMGAATYLSTLCASTFITPIWGSFVTAFLLPFLIEWLKRYDRSDSLLSSLWALGMSLGTIFISLSQGYQRDLMSYLFGNVLLNTKQDVFILALFSLFCLVVFVGFMPQLLMFSFDREWFSLSFKKKTIWIERGLLCLLSLGVVLLSRVVGIVLVIALLTLPASIANLLTQRLKWVFVLTFAVGLMCFWAGLFFSYLLDLPCGSTIVSALGICYFLSIWLRGT